MATTLSDLLDEKQIALHLSAREQPAALREIVLLLADNGKIDNPETFLEQLLAREQARPGAVEHGVAFPHVRTDLVDQIVLGVGRSKSGIPFGEGGPANLIFVIGVPQRLVNDYLICVGTLARLLKDESIRAALMRAKTAAQFVDILKNAELP
jgi:mannitol/fructose-specific phosphotransferase system IIA component (Ntr-type)